MTVLEKHTTIDYKGALLEEISILSALPAEKKEHMDIEKFNPLDYQQCFMGQIYDSYGDAHRYIIGVVAADDFSGYELTPLEIWSARLWKKGEKEPVIAVFHAIKTNTPLDIDIQWVE
jgi:hypothetical protein